jgi:endonuclease YncB( thermonuclease family)
MLSTISPVDPVSKRDEIVPFERPKAGRWTRVSDYVPEAESRLLLAPPRPDLPSRRQRVRRRGLWLPVYVLGLAVAALWATGAFDRGQQDARGANKAVAAASARPVGASSSKGLVFGLCDQGGGTNCVVDGDSFYMGGKSIRVAGIEAPATHSARCDGEALLGWAAAERLHAALNSGTVTMLPVEPGHDSNGRLLRQVRVDGRDVGQALIAAGLARASKGEPKSWC